MAKEKELNLDEAKQIVSDWGNPNVRSEEFDVLKEASLLLLKEHDADFDLEYEVEEGASKPKVKKSGALDHVKSQFSSLGVAGTMALASAAYFQTDVVIEQTRYVAEVAEEKWEEFTFEHPNVGWHDPLASFTTIISGVEPEGGIEKNPNPRPVKSSTNEQAEDESDQSEAKPEEKGDQVEAKPEEKAKKKGGLFSKIFGNKDEDKEEDSEEKEESETQEKQDEDKPDDSGEKETEKEEVKEEPKKKGGLFSKIFGSKEEPKQEQQTKGIDEQVSSGEKSETEKVSSNDQNEKQQAQLQTNAEQDKPADGSRIDSLSLNQPQLSEEVMEVLELIDDGKDALPDQPPVITPDDATSVSPAGFSSHFNQLFNPSFEENEATPI